MLRFARLATLAFVYAIVAQPLPVSADAPSGLVNGISPAGMTATPPTINENDYKGYFSNGSAEVLVKPSFDLADGSKTLCRPGPDEEAFLYPASDFTAWMVENWIYRLQNAKVMGYFTAFPGANVRDLPDYLNVIKSTTVVRTAECDNNHEYVFKNVPLGTYVVYAQHVNYVFGSSERYNSQLVQTPDGLHTERLPGEKIDESHSTDGYLSYDPKRVLIDQPARLYLMYADHFHTVVHYSVDHS